MKTKPLWQSLTTELYTFLEGKCSNRVVLVLSATLGQGPRSGVTYNWTVLVLCVCVFFACFVMIQDGDWCPCSLFLILRDTKGRMKSRLGLLWGHVHPILHEYSLCILWARTYSQSHIWMEDAIVQAGSHMPNDILAFVVKEEVWSRMLKWVPWDHCLYCPMALYLK